MNNTPIHHRFLRTNGQGDFDEQLSQLLQSYTPVGAPVRFVFFDALPDNATYAARLSTLKQSVADCFANCAPVISYVAQAPCDGRLALEVHEVSGALDVRYKEGYITVERAGYKYLFVGGIGGDQLNDSISQQTNAVFKRIEAILQAEAMPINSIVRQWNYIEKIVAVDEAGHQHYQDFNDVRSRFYSKADWKKGYPAATGIGTQWGGVMVDLDALVATDGIVGVYPLDNPMQVPAHAYSDEVLLGNSRKTTPKFERGKVVALPDGQLVYISGTAAIRGEQSLTGVGIEAQTQATLENMVYLLSMRNLLSAGVEAACNIRLRLLRVYLKHAQDESAARAVIEEMAPSVPVLYVVADICRDELLIEMEGIGEGS